MALFQSNVRCFKENTVSVLLRIYSVIIANLGLQKREKEGGRVLIRKGERIVHAIRWTG